MQQIKNLRIYNLPNQSILLNDVVSRHRQIPRYMNLVYKKVLPQNKFR